MREQRTVDWAGGCVRLIDQTALPGRLEVMELRDWRQVVQAIQTMVVRGAPAIGCATALGLALAAQQISETDPARYLSALEGAAAEFRNSRPTAVNLFWAVDRMMSVGRRELPDMDRVRAEMLREALQMLAEDLEVNRSLGKHGAALLGPDSTVLTHCNAGALCAVGYGTALGVVRAARDMGKRVRVFADETRPRLQGMKLTAWELREEGIDVTIVADSMAAVLMHTGKIDCVIVGADRIAGNGDVANKIGTYGLAVQAHFHGVPFYVAAPMSTVDRSIPDGKFIPIEERDPSEITHLHGMRIAPEGVTVWNPAFDVTPNRLVTAIITERGVCRPPFAESLAAGPAAPRPEASRPASERT